MLVQKVDGLSRPEGIGRWFECWGGEREVVGICLPLKLLERQAVARRRSRVRTRPKSATSTPVQSRNTSRIEQMKERHW